jgi:hypothetical protein
MESPSGSMISAMFKQCDGMCGAAVRANVAFCDVCAYLNCVHGTKRVCEEHRSSAAGEYARHDVGTIPYSHDERRARQEMLATEAAGRRRVWQSRLMALGVAFVIGLLAKAFAYGLGNMFTHLGDLLSRIPGR